MPIHKQLWVWIIFVAVIIAGGIFLFGGKYSIFEIEKTAIKYNYEKMTETEFNNILEKERESQLQALAEGEEEPTEEEIKNSAIDIAKNQLLFASYIKSKKVKATNEEIEAFYEESIASDPAMNTKDDFFSTMEENGYTKEEAEEQVSLAVQYQKIIEMYEEKVEVTDEDIEKSYKEYTDFIESMGEEYKEEILPLDKIREDIVDYITREEAFLLIEEDIKKFEEESKIKVLI
jgi:FKBP-type peptidyl-prolyl cis-trans isomerase (trigger factor)